MARIRVLAQCIDLPNFSLGKWSAIAAGFGLLGAATPALAHHPFGGEVPTTFGEGLLSGLGHPMIGFDHLAFIVALGLLSALHPRGGWIPLGFLLASIGGTVLHLSAVNLPLLEVWVALSVLVFGVLLLQRQAIAPGLILLAGAIAGVFHGYAYGEAVIGAEPTPISGYLLGFTVVQAAIALGAYGLGRRWLTQVGERSLQAPALILCGIGAAFLALAIAG
ncbi:MAG: HupE/UreJ family protein [Kaiparowitsia implicata GSE-PSE-MK54-09C]|jgi:urease accessory protein|nr:HupE/UreJ family protein [Kaiparowitsia implicata GSE-PSE-MK54-09C]